MARKLRVQYPGAIYHAMNRGDRREPIFLDDQDRRLFLATLGEACEKTDWQVHAWCLMSNHFHLVAETPRGNLVEGMHWLLGVYTNRFNRKHKEFGHLFAGRYKALPVDGSGDGYLKAACDYVHLNPVRAGLLSPQEPLAAYPWSSYPLYLQEPSHRPVWLRVDRLLGEWGVPEDSSAGRAELAGRMEARRRAEGLGEYEPPEWYLGSEEFRAELLAQVERQAGPRHVGEEVTQSAQAKAQRIIREELEALGWGAHELADRRKGDPEKLRLATRLRRETTMTLAWIAHTSVWARPVTSITSFIVKLFTKPIQMEPRFNISCSDPVLIAGGVALLSIQAEATKHALEVAGERHPVRKLFLIAFILTNLAALASSALSSQVDFKVSGILESRAIQEGGLPDKITTHVFTAATKGETNCVDINEVNDPKIAGWQYFSLRTNSYLVVKWTPPSGKTIRVYQGPSHYVDVLDTTVQNRMIDTTLTVAPWVVPRLDASAIAPVWLAFFSGNYFASRKDSFVDPIVMSIDRIREADIQVPANWRLITNNSLILPARVVYYTDGKMYSIPANGIGLHTKRMSAPYNNPTTNAIYEVLTWTNSAGFTLPESFHLLQYSTVSNGLDANELKLTAIYEGIITNVSTAVDSSEVSLRLPEKAQIVEERFSREIPPLYHFAYTTTNGRVATLEAVRSLPAYKSAIQRSELAIAQPTRRLIIYVLFGALAILPILIFLRAGSKSVQDGKA